MRSGRLERALRIGFQRETKSLEGWIKGCASAARLKKCGDRVYELLRGLSEYRMIVYALVLILVMIFKPSGLCGRYDFSLGKEIDNACLKIRQKVFRKGGDAK